GARGDIGSGPSIAPEKIRRVEIVVSPEGAKRMQQRRKFGVKGREEIESLIGAGANRSVVGKRGTGREIVFHLRGGVPCSEDRKAGDQRARLAGWSDEIARGKMEARERLAGGMRVRRAAKGR